MRAANSRDHVLSNLFSLCLVIAQFGLCSWIVLNALLSREDIHFDLRFAVALFLELVGVAAAIWAFLTMGPRHLRIYPEPRAGSPLITWGPYAWIRHPMYSGLLVVMLGLVIVRPSAFGVLLWILLWGVLWLKAHREEVMLSSLFPEYRATMSRRGRFLPRWGLRQRL